MEKNVTVLSGDGEMIGVTYPKRAVGLVKKGRARYLDGDETVIVLASSPVDTTSQEDDMNNNFNFDEFIEKAKATAKVAGNEVSALAEKSAEKIDEYLKKLTAALHRIEDAKDQVTAEYEAEDVPEESPEETGEILTEDDLDSLADTVDDEAMRAKIRATVEREKARRQRAQRAAEIERKVREKAKEAFDEAAAATRDIAAWSTKAAKEAEAYAKAKIAEAKEKMAEREARLKEKQEAAAPELTVEGVLREIRRIEEDDEHIRRALESLSTSETADAVNAQAMFDIVQLREVTNRGLLEKHYAILSKLMQEEAEKKEVEMRNRERAYLEAEQSEKDAAKLSILEGLLENILEADETTGVNKLSFYMKTAEKMVRENPSLLTDEIIAGILEAIKELDETKAEDQNKLAFFMKLMG